MINTYTKLAKELIFATNHNNPANFKKLCSAVGITNILTCLLFYFWMLVFVNKKTENIQSTNFLALFIFIHIYLNTVLIYWSFSYENTQLTIWIWLTLLFIAPIGLFLVLKEHNHKDIKNIESNQKNDSFFHSFANSFISINKVFNDSINFLTKNFEDDFANYLHSKKLSLNNIEKWSNFNKFLIIAIVEALKQTKKINKFEDIVFDAHWYDDRYFHFALPDPKSKIMAVRYKYAFAFLVLDEFNNYKKILDAKKEIKSNMKFGTAKTIFLHWGKGFKIYINE